VTLIAGSKGIFDVWVDGELLYSKYDTQRFPECGEVTLLLRERDSQDETGL
jgi:predicted Rdx family selenoprotein